MTRRVRDPQRRDDVPGVYYTKLSRKEKNIKRIEKKMARKEKGTQSFHHASEKSTRLLTRSFACLCEDLRLVVCNLIEDTLPEFLRELPVLFARPAERELTLCLSIS